MEAHSHLDYTDVYEETSLDSFCLTLFFPCDAPWLEKKKKKNDLQQREMKMFYGKFKVRK